MRTNDKRRTQKTRKSRPPGGAYNKYHKLTKTLRKALDMVATGASVHQAEMVTKIPSPPYLECGRSTKKESLMIIITPAHLASQRKDRRGGYLY